MNPVAHVSHSVPLGEQDSQLATVHSDHVQKSPPTDVQEASVG